YITSLSERTAKKPLYISPDNTLSEYESYTLYVLCGNHRDLIFGNFFLNIYQSKTGPGQML
ncbi:hypothetical protein QUW49_14500, partial [Lacrimispora saccharolytica]|nr:hypothetical protein [Lacrimispora saccharolytica]